MFVCTGFIGMWPLSLSFAGSEFRTPNSLLPPGRVSTQKKSTILEPNSSDEGMKAGKGQLILSAEGRRCELVKWDAQLPFPQVQRFHGFNK